jgi:hypothetical protein
MRRPWTRVRLPLEEPIWGAPDEAVCVNGSLGRARATASRGRTRCVHGHGVVYEPAVTSWLVQFGQRTALMGMSVRQ